MKSYEYKSFENNPEWEKTKEMLAKYQNPFQKIVSNFSKKYNFNQVDIENALMYEIMTFQYGSSKRNNFLANKHLKSLLTYILIMCIFLVYLPFSILYSLFNYNKKYNLLYEEMWDERSWYSRYYKYIDEHLGKSVKSAIFLGGMSLKKNIDKKKVEAWDGDVVDVRNRNRFYDYKVLLKVLFKDFFYFKDLYSLSKKFSADFIYLYLLLLRRFLAHTSQVANIESKVLVAAGDYYWNPIKYLCYKQKIGNIILLQHNYKSDYLYGRLSPYCDYYFAHSAEALEKLEGINFAAKEAIGSLQLIPYLSEVGKKTEYDILLINQTVYDENLLDDTPLLDQDKLIEQYFKVLNHFHRYLKENEDIKALNVCKTGYLNRKPMTLAYQQYSDVPNIEFVEAYGKDTFQLISKSKLILNMYSSLGKEAYGLDKKVLWINYKNCCDLFEFNIENDDFHVLVDDDSYEVFEKRINLLLSSNKEVDSHYKKLKEKYMNIQENPAIVVANKIEELVKGG